VSACAYRPPVAARTPRALLPKSTSWPGGDGIDKGESERDGRDEGEERRHPQRRGNYDADDYEYGRHEEDGDLSAPGVNLKGRNRYRRAGAPLGSTRGVQAARAGPHHGA
jgi:hypothetical protein